MKPITLAAKLLAWYRAHGRDLPWRETRDAYKILVSEIMLAQTQVPRVLLFYEKWLKQFPNWKMLARATNAQVIGAWAGLGYNRRALVLRDIARHVVAHGEPTTSHEWLVLKGIGEYTSKALGAFAHHERVMPIDTNIRRVLGRVLLGIPFPQPSHDELIQKKMADILPKRGAHWDVPQALFDLATAICTKSPACADCPLRAQCPVSKKFLSGRVRIPRAMIVKPVERRHRDKPYPDRIFRGRILKLVREEKNVPIATLGKRIDPAFSPANDTEWLFQMIQRMEKDGLIKQQHGKIVLG